MDSKVNRGQVALIERNIRLSTEAHLEYRKGPNACKSCKGPILPRAGEKLSVTKKKIFCSQSCAASHNNKGTRRGPQPGYRLKPKRDYICHECKSPIKGHGKKFCSRGCSTAKASRLALARTKGGIFGGGRSWQAGRSCIQDHARKAFFTLNPEACCARCGYSKHVEVCHIKAVSEFEETATLGEINAISNLVGLCPNHHWEFDHGFLTI